MLLSLKGQDGQTMDGKDTPVATVNKTRLRDDLQSRQTGGDAWKSGIGTPLQRKFSAGLANTHRIRS
ncbi:MAG TPA: hypothetical protein VN259_17535 [Xanthomonadales bacterium]|nr:hypothetical protein [Xanthomonadales bacterium]